jgi:hypothetical protein
MYILQPIIALWRSPCRHPVHTLPYRRPALLPPGRLACPVMYRRIDIAYNMPIEQTYAPRKNDIVPRL